MLRTADQIVAPKVLEEQYRRTSLAARTPRLLFGGGGKCLPWPTLGFKTMANFNHSQGALCAHKSLGKIGDAASNVIALGVFGDPISVWEDSVDYPAIPQGTELLSYCEKTTPDPLCTNPTEDFPQDPVAFIDRVKAIWEEVDETHMNDAQREAVRDILIELPEQALGQLGQLATDVLEGHLRRWMLTPEHFWYGIDEKVSTAADDLVRVYQKSVAS